MSTSGSWVIFLGVLVAFGLGLGGLIIAHRVFWLAVMFAVFLVAGCAFGFYHLFFFELQWAKRRKARAEEAAEEAWAVVEKVRATLMIPVTCPKCENRVLCPISLVGKRICCSACKSRFIVRDENDSAEQDVLVAKSEGEEAPPPVTSSKDQRGNRVLIGVLIGTATACVLAVGFLVAVMTSHNKATLTEKQKAVAADAIKALGRIEAAVQVGVNYQQYGQLLIDAKAAANEADRALPYGEMWVNLREAMSAYADAGDVWDRKIHHPERGLGSLVISRYNLQGQEEDFNQAMQVIWKVGAERLAKARSLQQQI